MDCKREQKWRRNQKDINGDEGRFSGQGFKEEIKYLTENLYLVMYILANPQLKLISEVL